MSGMRRLRSALVVMVLAGGITAGLGSSVSAGGSRPAAPVGLEAKAFVGAVHLTWRPGSNEPVTYRMYNLTLGWTSDRPGTSGRWGHGPLESGKTYSFEVTAIDADGDESAPSNRVSVTIPRLGPPRNFRAVLDGDVVRLSWERPAELEPGWLTFYSVRLNGVLERMASSTSNAVEMTIPRVHPGTTHQYTVRASGGPASDPAVVTMPPSSDTTRPTTPVARLGFDEACESVIVEFFEESTDDTTPAAEIRYEALGLDPISGEFFVADYDMQRGSGVELLDPRAIRAVDAAGNRSGIDELEYAPSC
jgi:hypothetical protein